MTPDQQRNAPVGTALPPGTILISRWEDGILRDVVRASERTAPEPHPLWALSGALRGLGTDVDGILATVGTTPACGPMVANCEIRYAEPLRFDVEYEVTGEILGFEPKVGRRTGPFDLFTFVLRLAADGVTATQVTFVWVLPRRGADVG
jgi:hypothetical protein